MKQQVPSNLVKIISPGGGVSNGVDSKEHEKLLINNMENFYKE